MCVLREGGLGKKKGPASRLSIRPGRLLVVGTTEGQLILIHSISLNLLELVQSSPRSWYAYRGVLGIF